VYQGVQDASGGFYPANPVVSAWDFGNFSVTFDLSVETTGSFSSTQDWAYNTVINENGVTVFNRYIGNISGTVDRNFTTGHVHSALLDNQRYIDVWRDDDTKQVYGQVNTETGAVSVNTFLLDTRPSDFDSFPVVARLDFGHFVAAWADLTSDTISYRIYSFDGLSTVTPVTGELTAEQFPGVFPYNTSISTLSDGQFVIAWNDLSPPANDFNIHERVFNSDGSPATDEFIANQITARDQYTPFVQGLASGGTITAWIDDSDTLQLNQPTDTNGDAVKYLAWNWDPPNADFNGDGGSDILWQNDSGRRIFSYLNGTTQIGTGEIGNLDLSWHPVATGDFNGDHHSDVLSQNSSGEVEIEEMNGNVHVGFGSVGNPGPSWHAIDTGDFNGDGYADILWQNSSGEVAIWELNGTNVVGAASLGNPGPNWHAIDTGDFNADGYADILWQNSSGEVAIWELNGTKVITAASLGNPGPSWHAVATGDCNNDGYADIAWQNDGERLRSGN
jgi:hypothetical protein